MFFYLHETYYMKILDVLIIIHVLKILIVVKGWVIKYIRLHFNTTFIYFYNWREFSYFLLKYKERYGKINKNHKTIYLNNNLYMFVYPHKYL